MGASDVTTIKVSKSLRDRITAGAAAQHQTVQRFIEGVLETYERDRRMAAIAAAVRSAGPDVLQDWRAETDSWAALDVDTAMNP